MFDIGWMELMVIGVVALIVVGPRDLPEMFRQLGRITAKLRQMGREFSRAMEQAAKDSGAGEAVRDLKTLSNPVSSGVNSLKAAADKFEKWDPVKNAATPRAATPPTTGPLVPPPMPPVAAPAAAAAPVAPVPAAPVAAPAAAAPAAEVGPNTAALYEKMAEKKQAAARKAAEKAAEKAAGKPAEKADAPAAAAEPAKRSPGRIRKTKAAEE